MNKKTVKKIVLWTSGILCLGIGAAVLAADQTVGEIAKNVTGSFSNVTKLITGAAYTAGLAFGVGAIVKFKAHKDNPTQIPIGMPIALLFIASALIFLPTVFKSAGATMFGTAATPNAGGPSGIIFS
jgi:intracellular multiplication protein IcmD